MSHCAACHTKNTATALACAECGLALKSPCAQCGAVSPDTANFCAECGAPMIAPSVRRPVSHLTAEKRHLTILFCDLMGSTALSEQLDLDDLRQLMWRYHAICGEVVQRFDGYVAQYLGDGILAYFGYPTAHEDDGPRAVRAGLALVEAMGALEEEIPEAEVRVRVGIHTGTAVVGELREGNRTEHLALGEGPNVAARVQSMAEPNTVLLSGDTHRLVRGFFELESTGEHDLKGIRRRVPIYRALRETDAQSRLEAAPGLTPFVGRERELAAMKTAWQKARQGERQVALLKGDAGIGKSRLLAEFLGTIDGDPTTVQARCLPLYQNTPLHPFADWLARTLAFSRDSPAAEKRAALERLLARHEDLPEGAFALLAELLGVGEGDELHLTPKQRRQRTMEVLGLLFAPPGTTTIWIVEDLHWADPSTLEMLGQLTSAPRDGRLMGVLTCRSEFRPPWSGPTEIALGKVSQQEAESIISNIAGARVLPLDVLRRVMSRTEGIPLFVEELTRTLAESGALEGGRSRELSDADIPATVRDSLTARLDRTGTGKPVAQLAAVIGREFPLELLRAVAPLEPDALDAELLRLEAAALLERRDDGPDSTLVFRHALVRDAAYGSLLRGDKQRLHGQIAEALQRSFPQIAEARPELLAQHFGGAGLCQESFGYWMMAGKRATDSTAYAESSSHFECALEQLEKLPDSPARTQQELLLRTMYGSALVVTQGFAAPDVAEMFGRALEISAGLDEAPLPVVSGLWAVTLVHGDRDGARWFVDQFNRSLETYSDPVSQIAARSALGTHAFFTGDLERCLDLMSGVVERYDPSLRGPARQIFGSTELLLYGHAYTAWSHVFMGLTSRAMQEAREAVELARGTHDPNALAMVLSFASAIAHDAGDVGRAAELAAEQISLSMENELGYWLATATCVAGWAAAHAGDAAMGIGQIETGLMMYRASGARLPYSYYLSHLADAQMANGDAKKAKQTIDEAVAGIEGTLDQNYRAEILRLRGEISAALGDLDPAVESLRESMSVARAQRATTFELRAAAALASLLHENGRSDDAASVLARAAATLGAEVDAPEAQKVRDLAVRLSA